MAPVDSREGAPRGKVSRKSTAHAGPEADTAPCSFTTVRSFYLEMSRMLSLSIHHPLRSPCQAPDDTGTATRRPAHPVMPTPTPSFPFPLDLPSRPAPTTFTHPLPQSPSPLYQTRPTNAPRRLSPALSAPAAAKGIFPLHFLVTLLRSLPFRSSALAKSPPRTSRPHRHRHPTSSLA